LRVYEKPIHLFDNNPRSRAGSTLFDKQLRVSWSASNSSTTLFDNIPVPVLRLRSGTAEPKDRNGSTTHAPTAAEPKDRNGSTTHAPTAAEPKDSQVWWNSRGVGTQSLAPTLR